jgi:hypothetical protein
MASITLMVVLLNYLKKKTEPEPEICTCTKTDSTASSGSGCGGAAVDIDTSIKCICNERYIKNIYNEIKKIYDYLTKIPEGLKYSEVSRQLNEIKSDIEFNETFDLNKIQEILENIQSYFLISTKKENIQGRTGFELNNDIYQAVIMFCFNLKIYEELPEIPESSKKEEIPESSKEEELSDWELLESSELKSLESKNQKIITNNSRKFIFYINNDIILQFFLNAYTYLKIKVKVNINDIETELSKLKEVREEVLGFLDGPYTDFTSDIITRNEAKAAEAEAKAAHKRKYLKYKNKYLQLKRSNKL